MNEPAWRHPERFNDALNAINKKSWRDRDSKPVQFKHNIIRKAITGSKVTVRPLQSDPTQVGVFATREIEFNEEVAGLIGWINVKAVCEDSNGDPDNNMFEP